MSAPIRCPRCGCLFTTDGEALCWACRLGQFPIVPKEDKR